MNYLAIASLAVLASAGGTIAQDRSILRYSLDNGLDVILVPDRRVPTVVVDIGYKVGAMNEPPGRSGFAHLFEHLMFMGTSAVPDIDVAYGAVGVEANASTWDDHTLYYARGMSSALPLILSVEADRMANQGAAISSEHLDLEREVVLNEIRQNVLDTVNGAAWEALPPALFPPGHPYSRSVYGSIADLEAATIEDVRAFFDTYYVPNNAILAIVGDFDPDAAKAMIEDTFGRIPRGGEIVPNVPQGSPPTRARIELADRLPTPTLLIGWAVPSISEPDLSLLRVAEELLGNPEYGVLRRALVDTGLANNAWVHLNQGVIGSRLIVEISAAEGVDPASVEAAAREAVAAFVAAPLSEADFARERTRLFVMDRVSNEDPLKLADNMLVYAQAMDDPGYALDDDRVLARASAADVMAAADRWLDPGNASVALVRPGARGGRSRCRCSRRARRLSPHRQRCRALPSATALRSCTIPCRTRRWPTSPHTRGSAH
jgi:zinc protease